MSHPETLIAAIRQLLQREYPEPVYTYVIEKAIKGTRMHPDILIVAPDGSMQCAVEIGYTRPEKLSAYRKKLRIPDVRWYDKAGSLHADVTERVLSMDVQVSVAPALGFRLHTLREMVACYDASCVADSETDEDSDERIEELESDVHTTVVTDHVKLFLPSYCDKCGTSWLADPEDEGQRISWELQDSDPRDFSRTHGAALRMNWDEATAYVQELYGLHMDYNEGHWFSERAKQDILCAVRTECKTTRKEFTQSNKDRT